LFANIWIPKDVVGKNKSLPVFVWIHGGGFIMRSANFAAYWGDGFAQMPEQAILVAGNYRLGIFGFYSSDDTGANFGIQDQQMLLRWVQNNIGAFGGNSNQVTVIGQSAGAMSVVTHLASPGSAGLFQRAMAMSPVGLTYRTREENEPFVVTVARSVGCWESTNRTQCMKRCPWKLLMAADIAPDYLFHLNGNSSLNFLPWVPIVDGETLKMTPMHAFKTGTHNKVPTIVSTTRNETLAFVPSIIMYLADFPLAYNALLDAEYKTKAKLIKKHYAEASDTRDMRQGANLAGIVLTDSLMTCYARYMAHLLSQHAPTYLSTFLVNPHESEMDVNKVCVAGEPGGASCHAGDISFFLPVSDRMAQRSGVNYANSQEKKFAHSYTSTLIKFGSGQEGPFTAYNASLDISVSWDLEGPVKTVGYHEAHCNMFESLGFADNPWGSSGVPIDKELPILV